jgi:hypothetical protein
MKVSVGYAHTRKLLFACEIQEWCTYVKWGCNYLQDMMRQSVQGLAGGGSSAGN